MHLIHAPTFNALVIDGAEGVESPVSPALETLWVLSPLNRQQLSSLFDGQPDQLDPLELENQVPHGIVSVPFH
jgi:hypothetical protein